MIEHARYASAACLSAGGSSVVYRGRDRVDGRAVALKLLRAHKGGLAARELEALRRVGHPAVVQLLDVGLDAESRHPFLVLELVDGADLATCLERLGAARGARRLAPRAAATIVARVLDALAAAHDAGVLHRDVKPGNVLVSREGDVKLGDFGIARVTGIATLDGVFGTAAYMAPEQARGEAIDARADLYATGLLLYELLAGARPFASATEEVERPRLEAPPGLGERCRDLGHDLVAIVARALARDRADRFPSALAMRAALAKLDLVAEGVAARALVREALELDDPALADATDLSGLGPDPAAPTAAGPDAVTDDTEKAPAFATARLAAGQPARPRLALGVVALALAAGAAGLAFVLLSSARARDPAPGRALASTSLVAEVRNVHGTGVVFADVAGGVIRIDPLDDPAGIVDAQVTGQPGGGPLWPAAPHYRGERLGGLFLFDRRTGSRWPGWERPLDLAAGSPDLPPGWRERIDPFHAAARGLRIVAPRVADLDGDGVPEVVAIAKHESGEATTGVFAVDVATRRILGAYFQYGVFEVSDLADLDGDGVLDLLCRGVLNRVELEGTPAFHDPAVAFALSGRALLEGSRAIGPPGSAAAPTTDRLLWCHVLPFCRGKGRVLSLGAVVLAWQAHQGRVVLRLDDAGREVAGGTLVEYDSGVDLDRRRRIQVLLDATGEVLEQGSLYDPVELPPLIPLVLGGRAQPLLDAAEQVERDGERVPRLVLPRSRWHP